ncbi:MAG: response regulator [Betaproteobacteria bacterium]|nr:response regulator [Betaproteobacteria bacterium]
MSDVAERVERDKANILIVDDLPDKLLVFETILEGLGQNLVMVRSGSEALAEVLRREFAVILLDVNMPDIDGLETAEYVRQYKKSAHTPIIFITAYADEMQTAKGYSLGAVDYILSPIQPEILRSKVKVFVELFHLQQQTRIMAEERVALERAETARRAAEEANRLKDEFIAMLSHELRNPLAPIRTAMEVIRRTAPADPGLALASNMMERQVAHLVRLVDELLDMARMGRGRITLKKEQLELERVIAHGLEPVRPLIESRRHTLTVSVPPAPVWISGDFVRLGQIITNLVSNAAKFTREGGRIQVDATASRGQAVIVVRDTGVGIEPQVLPRIFELFVQGERSLDRSEGGMGIGLTLARQLAELHQGRIEAYSEGPGKGAVFTVFLPCINAVATAGAAPAVSGAPRLRDRRVLVVDDNADAAESTAMLLRLAGHETRVITEAAEVISAAAEFMPHVVVLDIGLPRINGYELARQLRQQADNAEVVLIALTGYGQKQDRERAAEAGFDYYFVKPFDPGEFEAAIGAGPKNSGKLSSNGTRASS